MKNKIAFVLATVIALLSVGFLVTTPILALSTGGPEADAFTRSTDSDPHNGAGNSVNSGGVGGACDVNETSYLRWDLSGLNAASVSTVDMNLTVFSAPNVGVALSLYKVADDTWLESTVSHPGPTVGDLIQTISVAANAPDGTQLNFQNAALIQYVKDSSGGKASFAIQMTACGGDNSPTVLLYDKENGTSGTPSSGTPGTAPFLKILDPTAVSLASFTAASAPIPPFARYAIFTAVIGLAAVALVWIRRR